MVPEDTGQSVLGVVATLQRLDDSRFRLRFDDATRASSAEPDTWRAGNLFTYIDLSRDGQGNWSIKPELYRQIGENLLIRLAILSGLDR